MNSFDISARFASYYQSIGYRPLPTASLLDPSIPMTFVMSAGLVQVETALDKLGDVGDGSYVLQQKCFRHFDLDRIGSSNVHLSLFEMPGAFTFARNSKAETIQRMWHLITGVLKIAPNCLSITYFNGGVKGDHEFPPDMETCQIWRQIGLSEEQIVALGPEDNFWLQGGGIDGRESIRKCGPNTEVFFDRGEAFGCGASCRPGCRCGRFVEFANSLFIFAELNEKTSTLRLMDRPFNETVIGTERVAMIAQGKASVFEIDCMRPLLDKVREFCNGVGSNSWAERSQEIICDYVRALLFLVADGAPPPGKGGRSRIVKLLVRGVLTQQEILEIASPAFLPGLIDSIIAIYGEQHPGLVSGKQTLLDYFADERLRFAKTLQRGYQQLDRLAWVSEWAPSEEQLISLVKGFGVPLPLARARLQQRGIELEQPAYQYASA
ncbi:MAG: alanine--tRNA ligase-related protein [Chloroflexi bacterium]|nr:alanine--tRNA ligase-related protein [Chloroflexota bacterium]